MFQDTYHEFSLEFSKFSPELMLCVKIIKNFIFLLILVLLLCWRLSLVQKNYLFLRESFNRLIFFLQELVPFLRHIAPMVAKNHRLVLDTSPQLPVLEILNQVGFQRFKSICLYGNSYENAELILRLPCVQKVISITLAVPFYSVIPVDPLAKILIEWLHLETEDEHVENRSIECYNKGKDAKGPQAKQILIILAASTQDNQNDFLRTFWQLLKKVHFLFKKYGCDLIRHIWGSTHHQSSLSWSDFYCIREAMFEKCLNKVFKYCDNLCLTHRNTDFLKTI
jgi:hypothetical protein